MARRSGFWSTLQDLVIDTAGHQVSALESLSQVDDSEAAMDAYQERAYTLIATIARCSTDLDAQDMARRALTQLYMAETLEDRIGANVHNGHGHVETAQVCTWQTISLTHTRQTDSLTWHWKEGR
ncbi:MAG: hypothetical protein ACE5Q6_06985 [Dehalococcoidia bacterium]